MKYMNRILLVLLIGLVSAIIAGCASSGSDYGGTVHHGSSWGYHNYDYYHHRPPGYRPPHNRPPGYRPPGNRPPNRPRPTPMPSRR